MKKLAGVTTAAFLLATLGCGGAKKGPSAEGAGGGESGHVWVAPPPPSPEELAAMAEKLGMTVDELMAKKKMMMDSGLWADEIDKMLSMGADGPAALFKDGVESNTPPPESIDQLVFFRSDKNEQVELKNFIGKKNLVLVFTRGYSGGMICPFCATQTAELAAKRGEFESRDAVVLVIYPGAEEHLSDFTKAVARFQGDSASEANNWPVLLDKDLTAVTLLDIIEDLASPSTFIINKRGDVVFAYVGANRWDRPSTQAILDQLDALQPDSK